MREPDYVLVQNETGDYEALYLRGQLLKTAEDGKFSSYELLEAIALSNISVSCGYRIISDEYDQSVIADEGWPDIISEIPEEAIR